MSYLFDIIAAEIQRAGAISFERFMELALYCPDYGYYEKEADNLGRKGDFQTSVAVGGMFGELLGGRFSEWRRRINACSQRFMLLEAGAHRGDLAVDILGYLARHEPDLLDNTEYWIVEPSAQRREWQEKRLRSFAPMVRWVTELPSEPIQGVMFSNELLDALPFKRVGWDRAQGCWYEIGVILKDDHFKWVRLPGKLDWNPGVPDELLNALPDGFATEICSRAREWWDRAGRALTKGWLLTFDYGLDRMQFFTPERKDGTLRSYHQHQLIADVLAQPGEQDITAHVDFTAIREAGERVGLDTVFDDRQEKFFTEVLQDIEGGKIPFDPWNSKRVRQFQTLTHPQHFGRAFRVLVQKR